jgi:hypothetical protein
MYTEARNDAKLRSLPDNQFRVWFNLLCLAAEQPQRGVIEDYDERLLAIEVANGDVDLLVATCNALQALRCVTRVTCPENGYSLSFTKFHDRQTSKPSNQKEKVRERVAKHREKKRYADSIQTKIDVTPCNAPVTPSNAACNAKREEENGSLYIEPPTPESNTECMATAMPSQGFRSVEDQAQLEEAIRILSADARTDHIAMDLGRNHNSPEMLTIAGWQWVSAAKKATGGTVTGSKQRSFKYFIGIAKNTTREEAEAQSRPATNGTPHRSPSRRDVKPPSVFAGMPYHVTAPDPDRPPPRSKNAVRPAAASKGGA